MTRIETSGSPGATWGEIIDEVFDEDADEGRGGWRVPPLHRNQPCSVEPRTAFTGELYRVVERVARSGWQDDQGWRPVRTRGGAPRTYQTLAAARSAATQLRNSYQRYQISMEVAVQRAPITRWEIVDG